MEPVIEIKKENGQLVKAKFKLLDMSYIDKIIELQDRVLDDLEDKSLYVPGKLEDFIAFINYIGKVVGCVTLDDELVAMGAYVRLGYDKRNYGYHIELEGEELLKVAQVECTVVLKEYRGNKLQKQICESLEKIAVENETPIMCATASPYNKYSVNTFKSLGYEIVKDKIMYGGLRRYVLVKNLY